MFIDFNNITIPINDPIFKLYNYDENLLWTLYEKWSWYVRKRVNGGFVLHHPLIAEQYASFHKTELPTYCLHFIHYDAEKDNYFFNETIFIELEKDVADFYYDILGNGTYTFQRKTASRWFGLWKFPVICIEEKTFDTPNMPISLPDGSKPTLIHQPIGHMVDFVPFFKN